MRQTLSTRLLIALWESCGKVVAPIERDVSGYIVNRLQSRTRQMPLSLLSICT